MVYFVFVVLIFIAAVFGGWIASLLVPSVWVWPYRWIAITAAAVVVGLGASICLLVMFSLAWGSALQQEEEIKLAWLSDRRKAQEGDPAACVSLAERLIRSAADADGRDMEFCAKQNVEAYKWLTIALARGDAALTQADVKRASLGRTMGLEQIADAERQALYWLAEHARPKST